MCGCGLMVRASGYCAGGRCLNPVTGSGPYFASASLLGKNLIDRPTYPEKNHGMAGKESFALIKL